jgi:hypothetical protein
MVVGRSMIKHVKHNSYISCSTSLIKLVIRILTNVPHGRVGQRASRTLLPRPHHNTPTTLMPPQQRQLDASKEAQIHLAIQALKQDPNLSLRCAAAIYKIPRSTLSDQRAGRPSRANSTANSRSLDNNKERVIVDYILELVA